MVLKMDETNVVLTDICCKYNKKISYVGEKDSTNPVIIKTENISAWNFLHQVNSIIKSIFLPKGYPDSVSEDYLEYQIWDTCQAFCSSISGTLTMRSVMHGLGVGSEAATPASAAITWIMKDGTGMVGSILFAWLKGSKLDSDCKKWRLFADILNDVAMFIELYIPFYMEYSMSMLCVATAFKALVGTAGSSTRAALITHQAIKGNIADVSAKDGSQEIFINLCAFIFGIFLLKNVTETKEVWSVMCTATLFHLIFNYKAVRCLKMNKFNSERFCLSLRTYLPISCVPTVEQLNKRESVFLLMGMSDIQVFGFSVVFGACLKDAIQSQNLSYSQVSNLVSLFQTKKYLILPHIKKKKFYVSLRANITETDVLKAYFHASLLGISLTYLKNQNTLNIMKRIRKNSPIYRLKNILENSNELLDERNEQGQLDTKLLLAYNTCEDFIEKEFLAYCSACEEQGWDLSKHHINIDEWRGDWLHLMDKGAKPKIRFSKSEKKNQRTHKKSSVLNPSKKMNVLVIS